MLRKLFTTEGLARPLVSGFTLAVALSVWAVTLWPSAAPAAGTCTDDQKPVVMPVSQLSEGMTGTGYTVVKGTDPDSFDVEILGVLPDGIAPGVDFILVQVSGPVIDQTGGIAFGFSGSPVYIDNKLVGSISYGFFGGDPTIGGVTPAEEMVKLFDYPDTTGAATAAKPAPKVHLTPSLRREAARAAGTSVDEFSGTAKQLILPVGVSGLNDRGIAKLQERMDDLGFPVSVYKANSVPLATQASTTALQPGDAVAGVASYGDLTFAGIGTVTAVCGNETLAFGHPFFWEGSSSLGMNAADIVTVIQDQSGWIGSFKIGNVDGLVGSIDQDRLTGIRGIDGVLPLSVPVTSHVLNPDLSKTRDGETDVVRQDFVPFLAAYSMLLNQDVAFDRIGDGTDTVSFTIEGTRQGGQPWSLTRDNMLYSPYDISFIGILELNSDLYQLFYNDFEDIQFTSIHTDSTITEDQLTTSIRRVQSATKRHPNLRVRRYLKVRPGDVILLRVFLKPYGSDTATPVDLRVRVPLRARGGGSLTVRGANQSGFYYYYYGNENQNQPKSFDELLANLQNKEHGYDLIAQLSLTRPRHIDPVVSPQTRVVLGERVIEIRLRRTSGTAVASPAPKP